MKTFIITIPEHEESIKASQNCMESFKKFHDDWPIKVFAAVTPRENLNVMKKYNLRWDYPWEGTVNDFKTGLLKVAYPTVNPPSRISCALSHWMLWKRCSEEEIPYIILEHDSIFIKKLELEKINLVDYDIVGINDPRGATRKAMDYYNKIQASIGNTIPVPVIDNWNRTQGLAGNSAYIITKPGADKMLKLVKEHGLWPNDALMCRQLISRLGVTTTHYTTIQKMRSTTTL